MKVFVNIPEQCFFKYFLDLITDLKVFVNMPNILEVLRMIGLIRCGIYSVFTCNNSGIISARNAHNSACSAFRGTVPGRAGIFR